MFIIFGWNQPDVWNHGTIGLLDCEHCNKLTEWDVMEVSKSYSLFFIPILKQEKSFMLACAECKSGIPISAASVPDYKQLIQIQSDYMSNKISLEERDEKAAQAVKLAEEKAQTELDETAKSFSGKIATKSDQELLDIYHKQSDAYTPGFLQGVHAELEKRKLLKK